MKSSIICLPCVLLLVIWVGKVFPVTIDDINALKDEFSKIQNVNSKLSSDCDYLKTENIKLWAEVNHLSAEVRDLQQYTRIDNVEISGVPQLPDENIYEVLKKICAAIGVSYDRKEISEAHRLPKSKQGHPFIIVRFISRRVRDQWLSAGKSNVGNVQQIYPDLPSAPFFVNQHLTSYKKVLLDMAKRLVAEGVYSFAWVKDGKVYVRKTPSSRVIRIRTFEDFDEASESDRKTNNTNIG